MKKIAINGFGRIGCAAFKKPRMGRAAGKFDRIAVRVPVPVGSISDEPLVSSDMIKSPFAATVDLEMTRVVDGDLVKVMAWYDNEWGFTNQMIRQIQSI